MPLTSHSLLYFLLCSLSDLAQHRQTSQADGNEVLMLFFLLTCAWNSTHRVFSVAIATHFLSLLVSDTHLADSYKLPVELQN